MSAHTPGPWTIEQATPPPCLCIRGSDQSIVATLFSGEANARLIAAVPDLLAACLRIRERLDRRNDRHHDPEPAARNKDWNARIDELEAAIALAEKGA